MTDSPNGPAALARLLRDAERGSLPPADGVIRVLGQPRGGDAAVVAFTSHIVVAADVEPDWVVDRLPTSDLSEAMNPPFLAALCERTGRRVNSVDMVVYAPALAGGPPVADLTELDERRAHPRVRRARRYRSEIRAWATAGGVVVLGRGLAGRVEVAFEVDPDHRGRGLGRMLARSARHLARDIYPERAGVWAQVAPGNAASVRTLLAAGYQTLGAEALLV